MIIIQRCHEVRDSWLHLHDVTFHCTGLGNSDGHGQIAIEAVQGLMRLKQMEGEASMDLGERIGWLPWLILMRPL